jgi:hypothetical protein
MANAQCPVGNFCRRSGWLTFHVPADTRLSKTGDGLVAISATFMSYGLMVSPNSCTVMAPSGLLLDDSSPRTDFSIANNVVDPDFHQVATAQFAVDSQIKKRSISNPPVLIKKEARCPNLTRFERSLCANLASSMPRNSLASRRIKFR